jgi:hypothetical protein
VTMGEQIFSALASLIRWIVSRVCGGVVSNILGGSLLLALRASSTGTHYMLL